MTYIGSPNYNTGRGKIDRVILHWMAGTLAGTDKVFQLAGGVSAHYGIENTKVHQYVKEANTAFHAGNYAMNLRSIGIEHSAAPGRDASKSTIETSAKLLAKICKKYGIPLDRKHILKHSEVNPTQCPGTLPIDEIIKKAKAINAKEKEMITAGMVGILVRVRCGRPATDEEKKDYAGKETVPEFWERIQKWGTAKTAVSEAKSGKLDATRFLVGEIRTKLKKG